LSFWWRRGRLQLLIPYFLCRDHGGKKRGVFRLRFDIDELFPGDGDLQKYLPDQGLPFSVGHPGVKPEGWQVFQEVGGALQVGQVSRHDDGGGVHLELAHDDPPLPAVFISSSSNQESNVHSSEIAVSPTADGGEIEDGLLSSRYT